MASVTRKKAASKAGEKKAKARKAARKGAKKAAKKTTKQRRFAAKKKKAARTPPNLEVDPDVLEFIDALNRYKKSHNRPFPTNSEVLHVLRQLGYSKS